nr:glycosyltransferase family 2 protein [uncultured Psychroserpens sp.]
MNLKSYTPSINQLKDKNYKYRFSVFTPVYNAEKTIKRVHDSLVGQSFKDFEWIIINDGSNDDSHNTILNIKENSPLTINYVNNKKNKHKMACFFQAIELANGDFFLTFDADDECVPNALEVFNNEYESISNIDKSKIAAVTGLCKDQHGNLIGDKFPSNPYISNPFHISAIDSIQGEKWGFTKTNILKSISYNDCFINNGFMLEGIIWNLIAKEGYKTKYINTVLRIYHIDTAGSISSSSEDKTALGAIIYYISNFNWFLKSYAFKSPIYFLKQLYFLTSKSKYLDFNLKNYTTSIDSYFIKFLFVLLWPIRKYLR